MGSFWDSFLIILESFGIISETSLEKDPPWLETNLFFLLNCFGSVSFRNWQNDHPPGLKRICFVLFCLACFGGVLRCTIRKRAPQATPSGKTAKQKNQSFMFGQEDVL